MQHDDTARLTHLNTHTSPYMPLPVAMQLDSLLEGKAEVGFAGMTVTLRFIPMGGKKRIFMPAVCFRSRDGVCLGAYGVVRRP